jgi:probable rRNA maturation factor
MCVTVYVTRTRAGLGHPETAALVKKAIACTLECEEIDAPCQVEVMLTDEDTIHEINMENRGVDSATDVLSFPLNELQPGKFSKDVCEIDPGTKTVLLGDMVICIPRCEAQGEEYGHGYKREVCYLAVHSTLHLLGYDHMDEGEEKRLMRAHEDTVMEKLKIGR